jgi:hypothetical protein
MNITENQFSDALTVLQQSAENRTSYILHPGKIVGDEDSVKKYHQAEEQQMSNHFLYGGMSAVQQETAWWQYIIDLVGLTFSKQSVLNKWSYQKMQTATEKSVFQMSFSTLLLKSNNLAEQADEISLQVNNLLAGVLNPEKTYLTAGILSVSEIQEILKLYPEICLTLPEFFMPGKVPMSTAMPQGGNKLLLADIYIRKCNKTQLGAENVDLSRAEKIEYLEQKVAALEDTCKSTKTQLAAENLNQAEKIKSFEQKVVAFNETLSKFQDYAKIADTVKSHSSLWTAGIVAFVIIVAFFAGVSAAIFSKQYSLKKRADVQDMKREIEKKAEQPPIAETKEL